MKTILTAMLAAGLLAATTAHADTQTPAQRFAAAVEAMQTALGPREAYQVPPSDPAIRQHLNDMRAAVAQLGTPAFPVDGMTTFANVCLPLAALPMQYILAGAGDVPGFAADPAGQSQSPAIGSLRAANMVKYQDETTLLMDASIRCDAQHMAFFNSYWNGLSPDQRTAGRIASVHQMQAGFAAMLFGAAADATLPTFTKANRDLSMSSAATYADAVASALPVATRQTLKTQIDQAAPGLATTYPAQYAAITKALAGTDCTGLCTVP